MIDQSEQEWDFFIAHAGIDTDQAVALYDLLSPHAKVFLDDRNLRPGDPWVKILPARLRQSRVIVVLVSHETRANPVVTHAETRIIAIHRVSAHADIRPGTAGVLDAVVEQGNGIQGKVAGRVIDLPRPKGKEGRAL